MTTNGDDFEFLLFDDLRVDLELLDERVFWALELFGDLPV
jgi:hypothetical protein